MQRLLTITIAIMMLQGCSSLSVGPDRTSSSAAFNPLTLATVNVEKYNADKQLCVKQVQSNGDADPMQTYTVIKFRACLVQKGYVLLS